MGKEAEKTEGLRNSGEEGTTRNLVNTLEMWPGHSDSSGISNVCRGYKGQAGEGGPMQSNLVAAGHEAWGPTPLPQGK